MYTLLVVTVWQHLGKTVCQKKKRKKVCVKRVLKCRCQKRLQPILSEVTDVNFIAAHFKGEMPYFFRSWKEKEPINHTIVCYQDTFYLVTSSSRCT